MKNLSQAIRAVAEDLGKQAYQNAMNGSQHPWYSVDVGTAANVIAMIYDVDVADVHDNLYRHADDAYQGSWRK